MNTKHSSTEPASTAQTTGIGLQLESNRREFLTGLTGAAVVAAVIGPKAVAQSPDRAINIARVAVPSSFIVSSENKISSLNDGFTPENSLDRSHGVYEVHRDEDNQSALPSVQYDWSEPVKFLEVSKRFSFRRLASRFSRSLRS
jgi:hypothetical protein